MSRKASKTLMGAAGGRRLRRIMVKFAIVALAVVTVYILAQMPARKQETPPVQVPPVNVTVMPVTAEAQLPDTFVLPAVVEPNLVVTIAAEVAGRVEWIGPQKGALVKAGDLLMRLNTDLLRAEFESAAAQAKNDRTEFERQRGLVRGGAAPSREVDQAATDLAISQAKLEEVRARLERTRIVAPANGTLNDLPVEVGEYVQAGTAVADIVDTDPIKVIVDVPERDIPFFAPGQTVEIIADFKGCEQSREGTVTFISKVAQERTRSTRMEVTRPNPDGCLRSGQIVRVRLTRRVIENAIMIPLLAVIPMEESKAVYVVESGKAQRREIELGIIQGDRIQVTAGLKPGDQLIVSGHRFVSPGQDVNVVTPNGSESKQLP